MKKLSLVLVAILFAVTGILAQTPNEFKYQAVLRDASGAIMANEAVTVDISILQGSASGTSVFTEQHSVTTTAQGLINLNIGSVEDLSVVDWSSATYFIEISIGGTVLGTSQLLSVPYAMHASTVENDQVDDADADATNELQDLTLNGTTLEISDGTSADLSSLQDGVGDGSETKVTAGTNVTITGAGTSGDPYIVNATAGGSTHYIGELFGGGVVFWLDETGEHGLIVSMVDISTSQAWSDVTNTEIGSTAQSDWDGQTNSTNIIAQSTSTSAADICATYTNADYGTGTYSDWYLPSIGELNHIWNNFYEVQKAIDTYGNGTTTIAKAYYWSSSERDAGSAWVFNFSIGSAYGFDKGHTFYVRGVRAF